MSWLFSQALEAAYSEATCSDGEPSAPLKSNHTPQAYLSPDRMTAFSRLSRFGMTFAPLTEIHGEALLTWCRVVSLARISVAPEKEPDLTANEADCGESLPGSLARYDRDTHSLKTHQCSLFADLSASSVTLPRWGIMHDGELYPLPTPERVTSVNDFGVSLPTPSGVSNHRANHVMGRMDEWGGSSNPFRGTEIGKVRCATFEEWMMGWPMGWSDLTVSATDRFLVWRHSHGISLQEESNEQ